MTTIQREGMATTKIRNPKEISMVEGFEYLVMTIIECDIATCAVELQGFLTENNPGKWEITDVEPDYKEIYYPSPKPGGAHMSKILLWESKNLKNKTVFFANNQDGRYTLIYNYCKKFERSAIMVSFSNAPMQYPAFKLHYFDYTGGKTVERTVYTLKDGSKWAFFTKGAEQPFEDLANYEKKRKTERFNKAIILSYLLKLGIDIEDEKFWQSNRKGIYFNQLRW